MVDSVPPEQSSIQPVGRYFGENPSFGERRRWGSWTSRVRHVVREVHVTGHECTGTCRTYDIEFVEILGKILASECSTGGNGYNLRVGLIHDFRE